MRHISLYICDPNFSCGLTDGLTKVFHEALADLKNICDSLTCYDDDIVPCNSFMFCLTNLYSQQPNANETVMQDVH